MEKERKGWKGMCLDHMCRGPISNLKVSWRVESAWELYRGENSPGSNLVGHFIRGSGGYLLGLITCS